MIGQSEHSEDDKRSADIGKKLGVFFEQKNIEIEAEKLSNYLFMSKGGTHIALMIMRSPTCFSPPRVLLRACGRGVRAQPVLRGGAGGRGRGRGALQREHLSLHHPGAALRRPPGLSPR